MISLAGQASSSFIVGHVEDWSRKPYLRGAYSFSTVGMGNAREIAAQSLADKLFIPMVVTNLFKEP
jgi:hypothetical protein